MKLERRVNRCAKAQAKGRKEMAEGEEGRKRKRMVRVLSRGHGKHATPVMANGTTK